MSSLTYVMNKTQSLKNFVYLVGLHIYYARTCFDIKMSSSGSSLLLAKITYRFLGLGKIKLLKYKLIDFNGMLIVQRNKRLAYVSL